MRSRLGERAPGWANALPGCPPGWANGRPATLGQPPNADQPILESTRDIPHYFISSLSTANSFSCRRHRPRGFSNATLNTLGASCQEPSTVISSGGCNGTPYLAQSYLMAVMQKSMTRFPFPFIQSARDQVMLYRASIKWLDATLNPFAFL